MNPAVLRGIEISMGVIGSLLVGGAAMGMGCSDETQQTAEKLRPWDFAEFLFSNEIGAALFLRNLIRNIGRMRELTILLIAGGLLIVGSLLLCNLVELSAKTDL